MATINDDKANQPNKKMKTYFLLSVLILLIISIFIFYFIGSNNYSAEKQIEHFEQAIANKDLDQLENLLHTTETDFKFTEENLEQLHTYLTSNNEKLQQLIQKWKQQADGSQSAAKFASIDLIVDGKKWLLFDNYQFQVTPAYINPMANSELITFFINDIQAEDITPLTDKGYGPFMLGQYELTAVFDNSYSVSEQASTVELYDSSVQEVVHSFEFPIEEIFVEAKDEGYFLKVNDEVTSITLEQGEQSIGDFLTDGSISLAVTKEFPWGEVTSTEQTINSGEEVFTFELEHSLSEDARLELMKTMNTVFSGYQDALNAKDSTVLTENVTPTLINQLEKRIEEVKQRFSDYEGKLVKVIYSENGFTEPQFDEDLDAYVLQVKAHHIFYEPNNTLGYIFVDKDKEEYTRTNELTVLYDEAENEWVLDRYNTYYGVITPDEEINFEL